MRKTSEKSPRLLADESLGLKVAQNLAKLGFNIVAIGDVARGATNGKVLTQATDEKRILVTTDKDFGYLVFKEKLAVHGVIKTRETCGFDLRP